MPRTDTSDSGLRRTPVQRRSTERLERILDACARELDEGGYERLSTRAVAARAGVPIGSVYRFFSDKRAMTDALAHRNLEEFLDRTAARLAEPDTGSDWRAAVDVLVDEYTAMKRTAAGFALVDFGVPGETNHDLADRLPDLLGDRLTADPADPRLRLALVVAVEAADAALQLAFRADPSGDAGVVAATKELVRAYLGPVLD
ncbi:transcriptional regulator, TetR family [Streptomyces sp. DvalAA-14]|uniref:TetR/AcrR family transcriptional regulator n=1 Tax=unclassified Streptomyces TaxID=2593676 RepID=UPI00081BAFAA|nr:MULTISPECIES: TetR/AcrR family transcriptional regulator [unclassified Streptomyces]MYS20519.1 TetR family transcriptional regulator [Streptomyces sp. SID4948]SCD70944.1 transcriptional regulator, TetR family [Streptomyces sp. DvalAA-14]